MFSQHQNLKELLAQGNLESALETLVRLTEHADNAELRQRVLTLSGQFSTLKKQNLTGLLEDKDYRFQLNRITAAVAEIIDCQQLLESFKVSESWAPGRVNWKKWAIIPAILASIAGITGYTLRDFLWPKPVPVENPAVEPRKTDTIVVKTPASPPVPGGKNNVKIEVTDKAKVGTIITGDSNKIDVKQEF